ncbi:glycoside hydrolase family 30 beta sandwich domain-containing protein, partial [Acinetobacter baumannii]|uniref:glycoside hydrolase family 30 beta sandwich domain-containing protein n=1 Tax=Acinetobacter baumannii TaxID=470 RepID=UPI00288F1D32|nr:glucosylceramidase [Acinetobacter baumannii]
SNVAFRNRDGSLALVVANGAQAARTFSVRVEGQSFRYTLPGLSVATFAWGGKQ